jgi:pimeloyl-ACP methyl ester carboxylesterase
MLHRRLPFLVRLTALALLVSASAHAAAVTNIAAEHRDGQTFLTWDNLPGTGWTYHVYESPVRVNTMADIIYATEIGDVGDSSSVDQRLSALLGETCTFRPDSARDPLPASRGLLVHTSLRTRDIFYVVVADSMGGNVTMDITPGQSSLQQVVHEQRALPRPVWQRTLSTPVSGDVYVLFTSYSNEWSSFPAMTPRGTRTLHFGVKRGLPGGALLLHGHGRGGSFFSAMSGTGREGEWVIAMDDYLPTDDVGDFYYGFAEAYDLGSTSNPAPRRGRVVDYTDRGVMFLLDWAEREVGHDSKRVYAMGGSMGGSFATFLAWHHPDRIAAAMAFVPKVCFGYTPDSYPNLRVSFDRLWGKLNTNLPTTNGIGIFDWMDGRFMSRQLYRHGGSPVMGFVGRNDVVVGWPEKIAFFSAMQQNRMGGTWYWDGRAHYDGSNTTDWWPVQRDWQQLYRYRLDLSYPALSNCTADQDPGDGTTLTGDATGTINGAVTWDEDVVDEPARYEITLRTQSLPTASGVFDAPALAHVDVTPRRLQQFLVTTRVGYHYDAYDQETHTLVASGDLQADSMAILTVPQLPVTPAGTRIVLQPLTIAGVGPDGAAIRRPVIALSSNPVRGRASVRFAWPYSGRVQVGLYDTAGRRVRNVYDGASQGAGELTLATGDLAPGVYMLSARQGAAHGVERVVVVR